MKNTVITLLVVLVIGVIGFMAANTSSSESASSERIEVVVHKSPYCGCCGVYATYMERNDYMVTVENADDMESVKERFGIPYELESCHTMEVAGYVVEGHIPEVAVQKLLEEKPDIKGIGMAGMPSGSPGMPGPKNEPFTIYEINHDGTKGKVFMSL